MDYLTIASHIGTIAFAISGIIIGIRKNLDVMGVFILAFLTSSGGGILRDILTNQPPAIFSNGYIFIVILAVMLLFKGLRKREIIDKLEGTLAFRASDTIGLVAFAISGAQTALLFGYGFFTVVIISFLTAVGGGIIRDMLVNAVPEILKSGFYGSVAVLVGVTLFLLDNWGVNQNISIPSVFIFGILIRYIAIKKSLSLPKM